MKLKTGENCLFDLYQEQSNEISIKYFIFRRICLYVYVILPLNDIIF